MNHNLETVPRLYRRRGPGGDYAHSLTLLQEFKARHPAVPTKSRPHGRPGRNRRRDPAVMRDLRAHDVDMLTIGQYLQPSPHHLPVLRYVEPRVFDLFERSIDDGLQPRRRRRHGALVLPRRPAGARSRRGLRRSARPTRRRKKKPSNYPEPFASRMKGREKRPLGDLFGLQNFGVNLTRLTPGAISALRHAHSRQDEFIYILEGHPTLVTDEGETALCTRDVRRVQGRDGKRPSPGEPHPSDVVYLEVGDRTPGDAGPILTTT